MHAQVERLPCTYTARQREGQCPGRERQVGVIAEQAPRHRRSVAGPHGDAVLVWRTHHQVRLQPRIHVHRADHAPPARLGVRFEDHVAAGGREAGIQGTGHDLARGRVVREPGQRECLCKGRQRRQAQAKPKQQAAGQAPWIPHIHSAIPSAAEHSADSG
ncbi:MAG: hypothetical protein DI562_10940 [Stenotrophomonas acidaminiphila]|nr:MAG: hypothetical protein DI562_10940 [Stenotrophomonas acidaminiphila]